MRNRHDNIVMRLLRDPYDAFRASYFAISPEVSFKVSPFILTEWFDIDGKKPRHLEEQITLHFTEKKQPSKEAYWFKPLSQSVLALQCSDGSMGYMATYTCTGAYLMYKYPMGGWVSCSA